LLRELGFLGIGLDEHAGDIELGEHVENRAARFGQ
jgi:hypothetical protein